MRSGDVAAVDDGLHRRRHGDAGQVPAEVAGGVDLGGAVLAERDGEVVDVAADERRRPLSPSARALVSSSSVAAVGAPSAPCANTQMLEIAMIVVLALLR